MGIEQDQDLQLLVALSEAYAKPHPHGGREPIDVFRHSGGETMQHHGMPSGPPTFDIEQLERLYEQGFVRLDHGRGVIHITVTAEGDEIAHALRRLQDDEDEGEPLDLDWQSVALPTLKAAYEVWRQSGARPDGVLATKIAGRIEGRVENHTLRVIGALSEGGYLRPTSQLGTNGAPMFVAVTPQGLQVVGGWPTTSAEAATAALLAGLDEAVENAPPEERSRLERLRDAAYDVGQGTMVEVLKHVLTGGL